MGRASGVMKPTEGRCAAPGFSRPQRRNPGVPNKMKCFVDALPDEFVSLPSPREILSCRRPPQDPSRNSNWAFHRKDLPPRGLPLSCLSARLRRKSLHAAQTERTGAAQTLSQRSRGPISSKRNRDRFRPGRSYRNSSWRLPRNGRGRCDNVGWRNQPCRWPVQDHYHSQDTENRGKHEGERLRDKVFDI